MLGLCSFAACIHLDAFALSFVRHGITVGPCCKRPVPGSRHFSGSTINAPYGRMIDHNCEPLRLFAADIHPNLSSVYCRGVTCLKQPGAGYYTQSLSATRKRAPRAYSRFPHAGWGTPSLQKGVPSAYMLATGRDKK